MSAVAQERYVDTQLCWLIQEELRRLLGYLNVFVRVEASFTAASIHFRTEADYERYSELPHTVVGDLDELSGGQFSTYVDIQAEDLPALYEELKVL